MIVGNWKMYKTGSEARQFITTLIPLIKDTSQPVFLAVPFTALQEAALAAQGSLVRVGAQNMHDAEEGAFTGEISGRMLQEAGAQFVILGHSERRQIFFETNDFINRKVKRALILGLQPILCIGESLEERESHRTEEVLSRQLKECLAGIDPVQQEKIVFAYEPVWAIGTGKSATAEGAQETHAFIRDQLPKTVHILYGGSVKEDNVKSLLEQADIDGVLIGGASLNIETFASIVKIQGGI